MNTIAEEKFKNWKKNIILFLGGQTLSLFGSTLVQYAMMWYITLTTESGLMMTFYIICGFLPTFFLAPIAGVWADRYDRKKLIIYADAMIAVSTLILAIVFLMGYYEIWLLFVMAAIRALGAGIQTPAVGAILPQMVPKGMLTKVNGINGSIQAIIMFVAPIVSAALLTVASIESIFFIDVVTAAFAILTLLLFVKVGVHRKATLQEKVSYFADFKKGLTYINQQVYLKKFFLFVAIFFILMAPVSFLTPLQVARSFGDDVWRLTAIEIAFSIGMMVGGGVIASWGGFRNRIHTIAFSTVIMGVCTFALGIVPLFWIYLLFMGIFGVVLPIYSTPATVLLQENIEEDYLGRVFGVYSMISTSMMPLGMLIFGPVADFIKIEWLLIGTGILISFLSFILLNDKRLIRVGEVAVAEPVTE